MGIGQEELQGSKISQYEAEEIVRHVIDVHVHGPDDFPRKYNPNASSLLEESGRISGVVLKSHFHTDMTKLAQRVSDHSGGTLSVFGSLTLNHGFLSESVQQAIKDSGGRPLIIWGPTIAARASMDSIEGDYAIPDSWVKGSTFPAMRKDRLVPVTCLDEFGHITPECIAVLETLRGTSGIFASGHLSGEETYKIGIEARKRNIPFIATHVLLGDRSPLTSQQMEELVRLGAWLEFCYIFLLDEDWDMKYNRSQIVQQIKRFLPHVVVASDCGQVRNPSPSVCMSNLIQLLSAYGISVKELEIVMINNPRKILGVQ
jgi:hypothetical protein